LSKRQNKNKNKNKNRTKQKKKLFFVDLTVVVKLNTAAAQYLVSLKQ